MYIESENVHDRNMVDLKVKIYFTPLKNDETVGVDEIVIQSYPFSS